MEDRPRYLSVTGKPLSLGFSDGFLGLLQTLDHNSLVF